MKPMTARWIDAAAESFPMRGPIYEFGFVSARDAVDSSPVADAEPDPRESSTQVDRLGDLDQLPFSDAEARTVVCVDALRHVFEPHRAIAEMIRILAPGGLLVVAESRLPAAPGGSQPYWMISPCALGRLLAGLGGSLVGWIGPEPAPHTVFGLGYKTPVPSEFARGVRPLIERTRRLLDETGPAPGVLGWLKERTVKRFVAAARRRRNEHQVQYVLNLPMDQRSKPAILDACLPPAQTGTRLDLSE